MALRQARNHRAGVKLALLINQGAGAEGKDAVLEPLQGFLERKGFDIVAVEQAAGDVEGALARCLAAGASRVLVFGGDGTIAAAAGELTGQPVELAVLPGGTMNLVARDLGVPLDPVAASRVVAEAPVASIDVGSVNGRIFLTSAIVGLPTRLQREREARRGRWWRVFVWVRLVYAGLAALVRYPRFHLEIEDDAGRRRAIATRMLAISNNEPGGAGDGSLRKDRLEGGDLVMQFARPLTPWGLLRLGWALTRGTVQNHPDLETARGHRFVVTTRRAKLHVMTDGETVLMDTPLTFEIRRRALRVVTPEADAVEGRRP